MILLLSLKLVMAVGIYIVDQSANFMTQSAGTAK